MEYNLIIIFHITSENQTLGSRGISMLAQDLQRF